MTRAPAITPIEYSGLQTAYDHFNAELFEGSLLDVFITYQRKANSAGYFAPERYSSRVGTDGQHELALNPHSPDETAISGTFGTVFDYYSASYR